MGNIIYGFKEIHIRSRSEKRAPASAKRRKAPPPAINENLSFSIDPKQVARRCPRIIGNWFTRPQRLANRHAPRYWELRWVTGQVAVRTFVSDVHSIVGDSAVLERISDTYTGPLRAVDGTPLTSMNFASRPRMELVADSVSAAWIGNGYASCIPQRI